MTANPQNNSSHSDDVSLYGLFSLFIKNWITLGICGISFAALAGLWAVQQPNIYTAEMVLMPAQKDEGGLSGVAGKLGGLASLAGVGIGEGGNSNLTLAIELLSSKAFISDFIEENNLLVPVMAAEGWDAKMNKLIINNNIYNEEEQKWVRKAKLPKKPKPSYQEAQIIFSKLLEVEQNPKSLFVNISLDYYSPLMAADWATKLVKKVNEHIRQLDLKESNQSIEYLEKLIVESKVAELRNMFSNLMEEQIKSKMLASLRADYVLKVVDPAVVPETKSKPMRSLIVVIAGFFGGIIGLIIVLYRAGRKSQQLASH